MKKYVILSVNDNEDYLYFTPLTCWAWRQFGWEPVVFYRGSIGPLTQLVSDYSFLLVSGSPAVHLLDAIPDYRDDTITQISRLYGACVADGYLMTSDIDMIPLSDYWQPNFGKATCWGHDLTGFTNFPICYIGMPTHTWKYIMKIDDGDYNDYIARDLATLPQAKSTDWYKYWETDQDLITKRLKEYGTGNIDLVTRGQGRHGFARGRVDKGHGGRVLDQPQLIDAHMLQQTHHSDEKVRKTFDLLEHVWPNEDFQWFRNYTAEFRKLTGKDK